MPLRRRILGVAALLPLAARAETFPTRPIRMIVGFVPGGGADITARILAPRLSAALGQPVMVENRPGGAGNLSNEVALRAPPDGTTLLVATIGQTTVNPALSRVALDPVADSAPISLLVQVTNLLVVPADRPWRSVADLIAAAHARPGTLTYGSSSVGSAGHLAAAVLDQAAGIETVHVPYRGGGQLITDLLSGKVDFAFATAATTVQHVAAGRLRALAVPTARRSALAPGVPTIAESGVPGFDVVNWYGLTAPRGTPAPVIARLHAAVQEALGDPEVLQKLAVQGLEPLPGTPEEFGAYLQAEAARWARVVKSAGITAE
ncbi:Bug family tripartite tricarboxylate transporter substrate binding protein [Paracraurococcus lichenis]|uniref:Tripartite tricarboxylate transporter substrate binding protein n=1 Tax=Paracraurococcus lichenis TaxID=3064888 RepID=A0ABT9E716_9PROT|nr:tripartite tricarboxylate transporter substrate binding protein [Paracraurococcus sp. LOR1-02]MDO9711845.1 tripartite tricarboxylate transporter substrate binding protein [Paracraurococcus sp. LOR1-02]